MSALDGVEMVIAPRRRSIGVGDEVDRLLPYRERRTVGPFIYADLIGPDTLPPGAGVDVPVHPHIGLATITYLFDGALVHRDSTGAVQRIEPGAVNWMTAGRGVSHSEHSPDDRRAAASSIAGLQTWVALPDAHEDDEPSFAHVPAADVPAWRDRDAAVRLVAGTLAGHESPVPVRSPLVHADVRLDGVWRVPAEHVERGLIVVAGDVSLGPARHLHVLAPGAAVTVTSRGPARLILVGGAPVGRRLISWNFVASTQDRLERAAARWRSGDWPMVPGDPELVPLP